MGRRRKGRNISGILVLDKPQDLSSNSALQKVRRLLNASKAGHTGSLDPLATGVLPLCFGEATKFSQYLLDADKAYTSTFVLGATMTTGDAYGELLDVIDASAITLDDVEQAIKPLSGAIEQVPPMYSALKHNGQPLYKLARQGIEIPRKSRPVTIYDFTIKAFRPGVAAEVDVYIRCSKGTYVRSLSEDLGKALGCGAHVKVLRRVQAGAFLSDQQHNMADLEALAEQEDGFEQLDKLLIPMDFAVKDFPSVTISDEAEPFLMQGQAQSLDLALNQDIPELSSLVRIYSVSGDFLGLGTMSANNVVAAKRLVVKNNEKQQN